MPLISLNELESLAPVFRGKMGNALARTVLKWLDIEKTSQLYDKHIECKGPAFTNAFFNEIDYNYAVSFFDREGRSSEFLPAGKQAQSALATLLPEGPFITVSNHPCGHVDGMTLIDLIAPLRSDYKVLVNKILGRVHTLDDNFITVTPTGDKKTAPTAESIQGIRLALRHLRDGGSLGLFPSGAVSDLSIKDRSIRDRQWQEPMIRLIEKVKVPVLPIRFFDGNTLFYYLLGLIGWRVRLLRLIPEVYTKAGKIMHVGIGPLITVEEQQKAASSGTDNLARLLRSSVYAMDSPKIK